MNLEIVIDNRETSLYNNMIERDLDKFENKFNWIEFKKRLDTNKNFKNK